MASLDLDITTPESQVFKGTIDELIAPGAGGLFGVRPSHAPLLASLKPGILSFTQAGASHHFALGGGFIEIADDHVRVLADTADRGEDIDLERARAALADATAKLDELVPGTSEYLYQQARQVRAQQRIQLATMLASSK
ncbi:MAG: F0F1 ATP synthase subunit epsilon [Myxococcales bacterium]|jgi:F-type H+-transporting ATPase subunit epsilon|nr:F0F1 ATP synthase subunit epsilon [Myxococcales bacterium]